jgi:hypothetical protein
MTSILGAVASLWKSPARRAKPRSVPYPAPQSLEEFDANLTYIILSTYTAVRLLSDALPSSYMCDKMDFIEQMLVPRAGERWQPYVLVHCVRYLRVPGCVKVSKANWQWETGGS